MDLRRVTPRPTPASADPRRGRLPHRRRAAPGPAPGGRKHRTGVFLGVHLRGSGRAGLQGGGIGGTSPAGTWGEQPRGTLAEKAKDTETRSLERKNAKVPRSTQFRS